MCFVLTDSSRPSVLCSLLPSASLAKFKAICGHLECLCLWSFTWNHHSRVSGFEYNLYGAIPVLHLAVESLTYYHLEDFPEEGGIWEPSCSHKVLHLNILLSSHPISGNYQIGERQNS